MYTQAIACPPANAISNPSTIAGIFVGAEPKKSNVPLWQVTPFDRMELINDAL